MSYEEHCRELQKAFTKEQFNQVFSYKYNELSPEFLGFVEQYKALAGIIPKEFTIIDFGCNAAPQMYYFRNHHKYIGIDATDCICFSQPNAEIHTKTTTQNFIKSMKLDVNKCFAICNYVPDEEAKKMVRETFPNLFIYYPQRF